MNSSRYSVVGRRPVEVSDGPTAGYRLPGTSYLFLAGFLSIAAQVILLRELSAAFYGVDLVYLLALGAWLLWTAAGALIGRRTRHPSAARVAAVLVAAAFVIPAEVALVRGLRVLLGGVPGAYLPLPTQLLAGALCLLPASVLLGLLFQWSAKRSLAEGVRVEKRDGFRHDPGGVNSRGARGTVARAYAIESIGGIVGGLATTLTLHWRVPNATLAIATCAIALAAALARPRSATRQVYALRALALGGLLLSLLAGWNARALDRSMTSWDHADVVEAVDSPYGRLTVVRRAGQVTVYENDALILDAEATDAEEFAHLSLLQHEAPRRVLLVAGVPSGLLPHVAAYRPDRIDDVELDRGVVEVVARQVPAIDRALSLPAVHVVFDDARTMIAAGNDRYDAIVVAAPEPVSAQANRFFTREFFRLCAARLRPGGVLSLRLTSLENVWTPALVARTGSIYAALRDVFRDVVVLPGSTNIVLASGSPLTRDPDTLSGRLASRDIRPRLVTARYVRYLYSNDRFAEIESLLQRGRARANTDANAASYQATALFWLSRFAPSVARLDLARAGDAWRWSSPNAWLLLAVLVALAALWRWRRWPRRVPLVAVAAFAGMVLETLLLLHYQLKHGIVFQDLGALLMAVMGGLAAGAWVVDRARRGPGVALFLASLALLALLVVMTIETGRGAAFTPVAALLFATGAAVSGVFACATLGSDDQSALVSPLYAADVFGGCLGSIAATLLLVPLLGLSATAGWAAALAVVALVVGG